MNIEKIDKPIYRVEFDEYITFADFYNLFLFTVLKTGNLKTHILKKYNMLGYTQY